jgi:CubicO group peptidase (beta-lactamase class C family)
MAINDAANARVHQAIERAIAERGEIGVQVAAYLEGKLVIDAWAGMADEESGRLVDGDTLFNVFSVTKAIPATTIHMQAERGLLEYEAPIADYWPEWGCNGKEAATVRDALTHCTGAPQMPKCVTPETIGDWDLVVGGIAKLPAIYPVGRSPAYMAGTYGWVLGEIVRRTDPKRRSYEAYVQEELCAPLGITDLWIGVPERVEPRIAKLTDNASGPPLAEDLPLIQAVPNTLRLTPEIYNRSSVRRACIGATGGIFNARSEARFWALLANGGALDGVRLLSRERIDAACILRANNAPDPVHFNHIMPITQGGYWLHDPQIPLICPAKGKRAISIPGHGASLGWADPDTGLAVAFCHNYMSLPMRCEDHPAFEIANVIREALGVA